jgi:glycosyltransferase involved in cell wall biosynthesis
MNLQIDTKRPIVVFVLPEYIAGRVGGIGRFYQHLIPELYERGIECYVITPRAKGYYRQGVFCSSRWLSLVSLVPSCFFGVVAWAWLLNPRFQSAIVETSDYGGVLGPTPGQYKLVRANLSSRTINKATSSKVPFWYSIVEGVNLATANHLIAASQKMYKITKREFGLIPRRCEVIHNGVTRPKSRRGASECRAEKILFVGSLTSRKGSIFTSEIFCSFAAKFQQATLTYLGGDTIEFGTAVSEKIMNAARGYESRVKILGLQSPEVVEQHFTDAKILLFPSRLEAFGLVVVEAMFNGCVPIVPAEEPFLEILGPDLMELTVNTWDVKDWRARVRWILSDDRRWARLSSVCIKRAEEFSIQKCGAKSAAIMMRNAENSGVVI